MCALGWPTDLVFTHYATLVVSYTLSISIGLAILCGKKKETKKGDSTAESTTTSSTTSSILKTDKRRKKSKESKSKESKAQTPSSKRRPVESVRKGIRIPVKPISELKKAESLKSAPPIKSISPMPLQSAAKTLQLQTALGGDLSRSRPLSLSQMSTLKETAPGSDGEYEDVNIGMVEPELATAAPGGEKLVDARAPLGQGMDEDLKTVKPEALRDVPPTGDVSKTTLTVDPPVSTFPTTGGRLFHTLKNPRPTRMVFKIKCSNNNDYGINPVYGFIEANGTVPINITRLPGPPKDDRMVIQFVETTEAPSTGAEKAFKLASPWSYVSTTVPLRVVAGLPPMPPTAGAKPPPPPPVAAPKPPPPPPPAALKPLLRIPPAPLPLAPKPVVAAKPTILPPPPPLKLPPPPPKLPPKPVVAARPTIPLPPPPPKPALPTPIPIAPPKPPVAVPKAPLAPPKPVPAVTKVPIATPPPPPKPLSPPPKPLSPPPKPLSPPPKPLSPPPKVTSPTPAKPVVPALPKLVSPPPPPKPGAPLAIGTGLSYFAAPGQTPVIPGLPSPTTPPPPAIPPTLAGPKGLPVASVYATQQKK